MTERGEKADDGAALLLLLGSREATLDGVMSTVENRCTEAAKIEANTRHYTKHVRNDRIQENNSTVFYI